MHRIVRASCCLLIGATLATAQSPAIEYVADLLDDLPSTISLDMQFQLDPVVLDISEELQTAKLKYKAGQWESVVDLLKPFIKEQPNHKRVPDARFLLGESLMQLHRYPAAIQQFRSLLSSTPNFSQTSHARFRVAEANMLAGNRQEARQLFEQFRVDYPQHSLNAYVLPYLGEIVADQNENIEWAKTLYTEALRQYPDGPLQAESKLRLALLYYQQQDFTKANELLFRLVETLDHSDGDYWDASYWLAMSDLQLDKHKLAADRFTALLESQPQHEFAAASAFYASQAFLKLEKPEQAVELYELIRADWPSSEYAVPAMLAEMRVARALGRPEQSFEVFEEIKNSDDPELVSKATRVAVEILLAEERFEEAETLIQPLAEQRRSLVTAKSREDHHTNLYLYGLTQRGLGRTRQASQLLGRVRLDMVPRAVADRVLLARIEVLNLEEDYTRAVEQCFNYETQFPNGEFIGPVRGQMIHAMVKLNRLDEAKIKFRQMQRENASQAELSKAASQLAESTYQSGDLATSRLIFQVLAKNDDKGDQAQALSGLAWISMKQGRREEATKQFTEFIKLFPNHAATPKARLALAQNFEQNKQFDKAIATLQFFADAEKDESFRAEGIYQLARLQHKQSRNAEQTEVLVSKLVADHPDFPQRDAALYLLGVVQKQLQRSKALIPMAELATKYPKSKFWSDAMYRLADQARIDDKLDSANTFLTQIIRARRDADVVPHALYLQGRLASQEKQWEAARKAMRQLLQQFPNSSLVPVARYGVAESFYQEGQYNHALRLFEILNRDLNVPDGESWSAMVQLRRAQLFAKKEQWLAAEGIAKVIETRFPEFELQHEADYLQGRANAAKGEFSKAREYYAKVIDADPNFEREITAMAQWMRGESHFHQKKYVLAIKDYEALPINANAKWKAASRLAIGKAYEALGDTEQAMSAYSRVQTKHSGTSYAKEAAERLSLIDKSL